MEDVFTGQFRIAEQQDPWSVFAEVTVDVATRDQSDQSGILIDCTAVDPNWRPGATFGAHYALDHIPTSRWNGRIPSVTIRTVRTHLVDTTNMVMAYAVAHAVWRALDGAPEEAPMFDPETRRFIFPK